MTEKRRLVLVGAGHAHVEVIRAFAQEPVSGVSLEVITPYGLVPYTGMVPGFVAGKYRFDEVAIDAEALARAAGALVRRAKVTAIDRLLRRVHCDDGAEIAYDIVSINIGGVARDPLRESAGARIIATKPVEPFIETLKGLLETPGARTLAVIGAGYGGIELSAALAHRGAKVSLIAGRGGLAPSAPARARRGLARALARRGVTVIDGADALSADEQGVTLEDGRQIAASAVVLAAGVTAPPLFEALSLPKDARGFLSLAPSLQSVGDPAIFAAGDCAVIVGHDLPKAGVYAVREGPVLAANLRAALEGRPLADFHPQKDYLAILSFWPQGALAIRGGLSLGGGWADQWKEAIDRRFIARYR